MNENKSNERSKPTAHNWAAVEASGSTVPQQARVEAPA